MAVGLGVWAYDRARRNAQPAKAGTEASEDILAGRVHESEDVDELIASLHKGRGKRA
jgi:hypothetical protein